MLVDRLYNIVKEKGHVCVGLDTNYEYIPEWYRNKYNTKYEAIYNFNKEIIDATFDIVACYKVQIAYYESLGLEGLRVYSDTLKYIRKSGAIVIGDIKRNDILKTAQMYAKAHYEGDFEADFITLNPYMGINDSIEPFVEYIKNKDKGVFVLVRTSNKGARDFQYIEDKSGKKLYETVAEKLNDLAKDNLGECGLSAVGAVIGCTNNEEGTMLRKKANKLFLLIPGYGAQGGTAKDIKAYLINGNGAVVNSSRGILLAYKKVENGEKEFSKCARDAVIKMRDDILKYL